MKLQAMGKNRGQRGSRRETKYTDAAAAPAIGQHERAAGSPTVNRQLCPAAALLHARTLPRLRPHLWLAGTRGFCDNRRSPPGPLSTSGASHLTADLPLDVVQRSLSSDDATAR